ncbi:MAG: type IV pili twitching motility protein PilT, partial [Deinococcota bacterium]
GVARAVDPKEFARLANDPNAGVGGATYAPPASPTLGSGAGVGRTATTSTTPAGGNTPFGRR